MGGDPSYPVAFWACLTQGLHPLLLHAGLCPSQPNTVHPQGPFPSARAVRVDSVTGGAGPCPRTGFCRTVGTGGDGLLGILGVSWGEGPHFWGWKGLEPCTSSCELEEAWEASRGHLVRRRGKEGQTRRR